MSETVKKQNFLQGAAILALATAVVKVIGAFYKIPLANIIGDAGFSYFNAAYKIYSVLLLISTAGLPIAMSRMISQANALGNYNQIRRVYKTSRNIFLILGFVSSLLMVGGCWWLAGMMKQPNAWVSILCLGPCALLMGFMSTYRGFFQGQENMRPTARSQMLEAVFKLVVGLATAFILKKLTNNVALAAAGAILGVTVSCLASSIFLYGQFRPAYRAMPLSGGEAESAGATAKKLLAIAIPITIGSAGLQLLTVVETGLYMDRVVDLIDTNRYALPLVEILKADLLAEGVAAAELPTEIAANLNGIYEFAQTIFNMPCAFIIPITASVLPAITAFLTRKQDSEVRETEESAARITGLLSLPCTVGLCILAGPVMSLLRGYSGEKLQFATHMMLMLGACIFLYAVIQYTNVILQTHGLTLIPVITMLCCGAVKLLAVYILSGNPVLGIYGVPICTIICYAAIGALNLIAISIKVPQKPKLLRNLLRPVLPAAFMGVFVYGAYWVLTKILGPDTSSVILCGVPVVVGVLIYVVAIAFFKTVKREDCLLLPKGDKIAKLLRL